MSPTREALITFSFSLDTTNKEPVLLTPMATLAICSAGHRLNIADVSFLKDLFPGQYWTMEDTGADLSLMQQNCVLFRRLAVQTSEAVLITTHTSVDAIVTRLNPTTSRHDACQTPCYSCS